MQALAALQQTDKPILQTLGGKTLTKPPFWMMRQAGRYLPEYREIRQKAGSFLDVAYNPDLATEVTMQPIRRFGMDAAILFSDILVVPHALGQSLEFVEGEGPKLDPVRSVEAIKKLNMDKFDEITAPVYETVSRVRAQLDAEGFASTTLIGFAGAPWTVATYMIEGGSSRDFIYSKGWAYKNIQDFMLLIDKITEATIYYLSKQIEAGAEVIQIFDSWAGVLDEHLFRRIVLPSTKKIVDELHMSYPHVPIIGFPKGIGRACQEYIRDTGVNALSIDSQVSPRWAASAIQPSVPVQGNLDPVCLMVGGDALILEIENIVANLSLGPFIFNLGHGIHKDTPVENVEQMVRFLQDYF